jgi:hypothetical protein
MSPIREAVVLPLVFLSVVLLGGVRIADTTLLLAPSVFMLVLGVLLVRVLVQCGALAPGRLLSPVRSPLANANGAVVFVAVWAASAQTLALLVPEAGLPRIAFNVFFLIMLVNTAAAAPDRIRLLRSLAVTFGAAFVLKFVVLYELSAPGTGWLKRVLQAMLEGITLGTLTQDPMRPITGYLAFLTVALYLIGVSLLPHDRAVPSSDTQIGPYVRGADTQVRPYTA